MHFDETEAKRLAEAAWASTPELRAEFVTKEDFIAYRLAVEAGRVRQFGHALHGAANASRGNQGKAS